MNFFKKKNDVDWKWITKQYRELGEFRIIDDVDGNPKIERWSEYFDGIWLGCDILRKDSSKPFTKEELIEYIYDWRYYNMKEKKSNWTYNKRASKALYIPPKKDK